MAGNNVCALRPFVVIIDVSLELPLITMTVTLCFGPFNSLSSAEKWAGEVERLHRDITIRSDLEADVIFEDTGIPTSSFKRTEIHGVDIVQPEKGARDPGALIPFTTPNEDAHKMYLYALSAFHAAITMAFLVAENEDT